MHKIRQILLFLDRGYSQRSVEKETRINRRTIASYLCRFKESGLNYSELLLFTDGELETYLNKDKSLEVKADSRRAELNALFPYFYRNCAG